MGLTENRTIPLAISTIHLEIVNPNGTDIQIFRVWPMDY